MVRALRVFLSVVFAMVCVVLVPSTAWSAEGGPVRVTAASPWGQLQVAGSTGLVPGSTEAYIVYKNVSSQNVRLSYGYSCVVTATGQVVEQSALYKGSAASPGASYTDGMWCPAGRTLYSLWVGGYAASAAPSTFVNETWMISGPPEPDPTEAACELETGQFRGLRASVTDGAVDLTWKWAGPVPGRGWTVTDAGPTDPVGAGAVQVEVPAVELAGQPGRYGLWGYTPSAGVEFLRVAQAGRSACFVGFAVGRDDGGVVIEVTPGGETPTEPGEPPRPTEPDGSNCSLVDIPCVLQWLFIPDPSSWDFASLMTTMETRPPFSVLIQAAQGLQSFLTAFNASGCSTAANIPDAPHMLADGTYTTVGTDFNCSRQPALEILFNVAQVILIAMTSLALFKMLVSAVDR